MNSYTWFTDLDTLKQKELCLKYNIDCHNVSLTDMDKMYAGEINTFIQLYYSVSPQPYKPKTIRVKTISIYRIEYNTPQLFLRFNQPIKESEAVGILKCFENNNIDPKKYVLDKLP